MRFLFLICATSLTISGCLEKDKKEIGERSAIVLAPKHPWVPESVWGEMQRRTKPRASTRLDIGNVVYGKQLKNSGDSDITEGLEEFIEKLSCMDPNYLILVDKTHPLDADFKPTDLVNLALYPEISRSRDGLYLEHTAAEALAKLSAAARKKGVTLLVSSAYRSYDYQKFLFDNHVKEIGEEETSRDIAKPGRSQHQLGTVVDFGDITKSFADTRAGKWMEKNGGKFGWSLSYPRYPPSEYMWESWHWRWIGADAVQLQDKFFDGSQYRMLLYLHENTTFPEF
ncbi:D-alanyl-D-alanine carboxypeptidase [Olavius algarvensis spirochete endosymbiont]|nr:D-alanyl-D-alanine carboxypeptidase [Olavius algarvensis spirochete endosymbiont]